MNIRTIKNVLKQSTRPERFFVMLKKVRLRVFDDKGRHKSNDNLEWIKKNCSDFEIIAKGIDEKLWDEAKQAAVKIEENAGEKLNHIDYKLGGGGAYPFLYFITRHLKPNTIVETGVAAGYSSYSFLEAINKNGKGTLFSSDFPYFRLPNPEQYIGIVVDENLKNHWNLYIDGDDLNIPKILNKINEIDLFHYDSDKSYSGRVSVSSMIKSRLSENSILIYDDIQDNSHFYDCIEELKPANWLVFAFEGKYVGLIGNLEK